MLAATTMTSRGELQVVPGRFFPAILQYNIYYQITTTPSLGMGEESTVWRF